MNKKQKVIQNTQQVKNIARFNINSISDLDFSFISPSKYDLKLSESSREGLTYEISFSHNIDKSESIYLNRVGVIFKYPSKENKDIVILRYTIECSFYIENFKEVIISFDNNTFDAPEKLSLLLFGEAFSTLRGLLLSKLSKSELSWIILPILPDEKLKPLLDSTIAQIKNK